MKNIIPSDFNWVVYVNNYKDLRKAGIDNREKAYNHWIKFGINEGRTYKKSIGDNFDWKLYVNNYKDLRKACIDTEDKAYIHWLKFGMKEGRISSINNNLTNKIKFKINGKKNILIYPHLPFNLSDGGITVQYYLAQILKELGELVCIYTNKGAGNNNIFTDYINEISDEELNNTVVIYCEGIVGNPLNAKYVVRWMLSELGKNVSFDRKNSWGVNELIYYFNPEPKFFINTDKIGNIYKSLYLIYINPNIKNLNIKRNGWCHTFRKKSYHKHINKCHPDNSFEIKKQHTQNDYIDIFNKHKYFISYDPLTFLSIISLLCGCISIVYPIEGIDKKTWIKNTSIGDYINNSSGELYGLAYGIEDLEYAEKTIYLAQNQFEGLKNYCIEKTIKPFLNDINNFENNNNNLKNNF